MQTRHGHTDVWVSEQAPPRHATHNVCTYSGGSLASNLKLQRKYEVDLARMENVTLPSVIASCRRRLICLFVRSDAPAEMYV